MKSDTKNRRKVVALGLVLCIGLSVAVALTGASNSGGGETQPPSVAIIVENANVGSREITLIHHGGDTIANAFKENAPYWNTLEVRINGAIYTGAMNLNGATVSAGDFKPGDELKLSLDWELYSGDSISVVYTPTGDLLQRVTVSWGVSEAPNAAIVVEGVLPGSREITLIHHGGDTIANAFKGNAPYWNSMEVRINGAIYTGTVTLNGATISAGNFKAGDELELYLDSELYSGDTISVVFIPTDDILQRVQVPEPTVTPTSFPTPAVIPTPTPSTPTPTSAPTDEPELSISQSSLKEEPEVGEEVLITVAILNKGKGTAQNIYLVENIPSSITINYVEGGEKAGNLVYWNGELDSGEAHSITHTLRILEEKNRIIPVTVTYEDAMGNEKQQSAEVYLSAEIPQQPSPTPSSSAFLLPEKTWLYIIILATVILVGFALIVAVRKGGEGGAEVTIEEKK